MRKRTGGSTPIPILLEPLECLSGGVVPLAGRNDAGVFRSCGRRLGLYVFPTC